MLRVMFILLSSCIFFPSYAAQVATNDKLAPPEKQVFIRQVLGEPASIDPQLVEESSGSDIAVDLFEGLFTQGPRGELVSAGAVSYVVNDNNTVYTIKLRKNARWSNGDPVRAQDYVYGWKRAANPETGSNYASYLSLMNVKNASAIIDGKMNPDALGVVAKDDYTLEVTLDKPTPYFLKTLTYPTTFPAHQKIIEKYGRDWVKPKNIVSNGAFVLKSWTPNEKIVLQKNKNYWDHKNTILNQVTFLMINNPQAAYNRYRAEEVHYTQFPDNLYEKLKKEKPNELINMPSLGTYYYGLNTSKKPFDDARVRKALSLAVDRDIIANKVLGQGQLAAYSFIPPYTDGFSYVEPKVAKIEQKQRIKQAKTLLEQAGFGPNKPLEFELVYNTAEGHKKIAISIANMWKQSLGAKVSLNNMEWKTMLTRLHSGDFDVYRSGWMADYNDGMTFLDVFTSDGSQNKTQWSNAQYDAYLEKAKVIANDKERNALYRKAEDILIESSPIIPIYFYVSANLLHPKVKGYPHHNPLSTLYSKDLYFVQ